MTSVERMLAYTQLESEAEPITDVRPEVGWPSKGEISISHMSLQYLDTTAPVLRGNVG